MTATDRSRESGSPPDADSSTRAEFDWSSVAPATAVVETVSVATDTDPTDIEPLYGSIDPDALNELLRSETGSTDDTTVSFTFAACEVSAHSAGTVVVRPIA